MFCYLYGYISGKIVYVQKVGFVNFQFSAHNHHTEFFMVSQNDPPRPLI